ncbi:hypothetical protein ElyMa_004278000 [Elysia marginata]|uniref:Uncharacterized protein n=1 Tax=Elysia marginata TaxID=1093978 RepID=A0AAV4GYG7_9GAST|nr:hypothetical protein ElyMa_004278000 [Elysia marginata]
MGCFLPLKRSRSYLHTIVLYGPACSLALRIFTLSVLLLCCGDIETNPGPKFDWVHRLQTESNPQPIIAKFTFFKDKAKVMGEKKKFKDTDIQEDGNVGLRSSDFRRQAVTIDGKRFDWEEQSETVVPVGRRNQPLAD